MCTVSIASRVSNETETILDFMTTSKRGILPGIASTQHHDDWIPVFSPSGSRLCYSSKRPTEGKGEKGERSRVVEESNPPAIWNLDLFEDLAIEENADRYWVDSSVLPEVLERQ